MRGGRVGEENRKRKERGKKESEKKGEMINCVDK